MKRRIVAAVLCVATASGVALAGGGVAQAASQISQDGTFRVGGAQNEVNPGLWSSSGGSDCYWSRKGSDGYIAENSYGKGYTTVEIPWGDRSFTTYNCGTWYRAAPVPNPIPGLPPIEAVDFRNMQSFAVTAGLGSAMIGSALAPSLIWMGAAASAAGSAELEQPVE